MDTNRPRCTSGNRRVYHQPTVARRGTWRAKTAGRVAFFFGPVAGAQVVAISGDVWGARRQQKESFLVLAIAIIVAAIPFSIPDTQSRILGVGCGSCVPGIHGEGVQRMLGSSSWCCALECVSRSSEIASVGTPSSLNDAQLLGSEARKPTGGTGRPSCPPSAQRRIMQRSWLPRLLPALPTSAKNRNLCRPRKSSAH
jgi:hypothetical protein